MCLIEDFFLDKERIRKVVKKKIEALLHVDFAARQALENTAPIQTEAEKAVGYWGTRYTVLLDRQESSSSSGESHRQWCASNKG
jgi:hypothetical protein